MRTLAKILPWILLLLAVIFIINLQKKEKSVSFYAFGFSIESASKITCTYPQVSGAYYRDSTVTQFIPEPETSPLVFTFNNVGNEEFVELSYIDSTQTITTIPVVKLIDNSEKYVFLDGTGENYLTVHTIYKEKGLGTYTKNVDLMGTPSASLAMGSCNGF